MNLIAYVYNYLAVCARVARQTSAIGKIRRQLSTAAVVCTIAIIQAQIYLDVAVEPCVARVTAAHVARAYVKCGIGLKAVAVEARIDQAWVYYLFAVESLVARLTTA